METKVDDEDFDRLSQSHWKAVRGRSAVECWYARNTVTGVYMQRDIVHPPDGMRVDHIDHDGLNNQKLNFRFVTPWENSLNTRPRKHSSQFKGVSYRKRNGRWRSRITVDGKLLCLGSYPTEEEAALNYNAAARLFFGDYAYLNEVEKEEPIAEFLYAPSH